MLQTFTWKRQSSPRAVQRDFWEIAIAVTTSDDDLSRGHVEYLEARLIELALAANRVTLDNATSPSGQRRRLPEADLANMESFLSRLKIILPVVGLDLLKPQPRAVAETGTPVAQRTAGAPIRVNMAEYTSAM